MHRRYVNYTDHELIGSRKLERKGPSLTDTKVIIIVHKPNYKARF